MKAMMPMMMPKKQARRERIMRARVASRWAVEESGMNDSRWRMALKSRSDS